MAEQMDTAEGIYRGRLMCDGQGNLLADESIRVGDRVRTVYDESGQAMNGPDGTELVVMEPVFRYGSNHRRPVAMHEGSYVFLSGGEPSHNERYHQRFAAIDGTVDESMTDDPTLVNADSSNNPHHFGVQPDDPHYDEDMANNTRLRFSPDSVAGTETSHTDAYEGKHDITSTGGDADAT